MSSRVCARQVFALKDIVIQLNCIFTISNEMVSKVILRLSKEKKRLVFNELSKRLNRLRAQHLILCGFLFCRDAAVMFYVETPGSVFPFSSVVNAYTFCFYDMLFWDGGCVFDEEWRGS
jgi:hypothetical protein